MRKRDTTLSTDQKALAINLDKYKYGSIVEIGAGQEVARRFFHVGAAAGTIAKTMSAYDMAVSDDIYGHVDRYVSRARLLQMGCTANLTLDGCFITAGHCLDASGPNDVVQFNVPLSNANGSLNHPPPSDQYMPTGSAQFSNGGQGNDWGVFTVHPNSETGLTPLQAQGPGLHLEHDLGFRQLAHGGHHGVGVGNIKLDGVPFHRKSLQGIDAVVAEAGFDGQQADIGLGIRVVIDLGGAHGGAAGIRGQQALLEVGEEQGVDEFGLAPAEFRHEGHHEPVPLQVLGQVVEAQHLFRFGVCMVFQPFLVGCDHLHQPITPVPEPGDAAFQTIIHQVFPMSRRSASSGLIAAQTALRRDFSPRRILTALSCKPRHCARNSSSAPLAAPSTARAATRIFRASPCGPEISQREAPG